MHSFSVQALDSTLPCVPWAHNTLCPAMRNTALDGASASHQRPHAWSLGTGSPGAAWGCGAACSWESKACHHTHTTPPFLFLLVPGSQGGRRVPAAADVQRKLPREAAAGALFVAPSPAARCSTLRALAAGPRRLARDPAMYSAAGSMHGVRVWTAPCAQAAPAPGLRRENGEVPCGLISACLRARRPAGAVHDRDVPPQRVH